MSTAWDTFLSGNVIDLGNSDNTVQAGAAADVAQSQSYGTLSEPAGFTPDAKSWSDVLIQGFSTYANYDLSKKKIDATLPGYYDQAGISARYRLPNGQAIGGSIGSGGLVTMLVLGAVVFLLVNR